METVKDLRRLVIRSFHITDVQFGKKTQINKHTLVLNDEIAYENDLVKKVTVTVIKPNDWNRSINTIMDIIPISVKALKALHIRLPACT